MLQCIDRQVGPDVRRIVVS